MLLFRSTQTTVTMRVSEWVRVCGGSLLGLPLLLTTAKKKVEEETAIYTLHYGGGRRRESWAFWWWTRMRSTRTRTDNGDDSNDHFSTTFFTGKLRRRQKKKKRKDIVFMQEGKFKFQEQNYRTEWMWFHLWIISRDWDIFPSIFMFSDLSMMMMMESH